MLKKCVATILAIAVLLIFAACNKSSKPDVDTGEKDQQKEQENRPAVSDELGTNELDIVRGTMFNDGLALVMLRDREYLTAIDTKGKEIFTLESKYYLESEREIDGVYSFWNGLIYVYYGKNMAMHHVLCDKKGVIHKPEDFGGTTFEETDCMQMLADSLIIVCNEEDKTMGTMNTSFNWLVPMSSTLYQAYNTMRYSPKHYYNGYLFQTGLDDQQYINLRTGETGTDLSEIETVRQSDLWYLNQDCNVIDARTKVEIMHIDGISSYLYNGGAGNYFQNGVYLGMYISHTEQDYQMRYYVLDDSGAFLVEPTDKESKYFELQVIAADDSVRLVSDDRLLFSYAAEQNYVSQEGSSTMLVENKWEVRDFNGNVLGSFTIPNPDSDDNNIRWISSSRAYVDGSIMKVSYAYMTYSVEYGYQTSEEYTQYFILDV